MAKDPSFENKVIFAKGTTLNVREIPFATAKILLTVNAGTPAGRATGNYSDAKDGRWYQVFLYKPVLGKSFGYVRGDVIKVSEPAATVVETEKSKAEKMLNDMATNDEKSFNNLLVTIELLARLKQKGKDVSVQQTKARNLLKDILLRQAKLKASGLVSFQTGVKKTYNTLFEKIKGISIGEPVTITAGVIIAGTVIVAAATAAIIIMTYRKDYDTSKANLQESELFKKAIADLSPAEQAALKKDLEKQVDDAYSQGKTEGGFGGALKVIKPLALGLLGYVIISKIASRNNN